MKRLIASTTFVLIAQGAHAQETAPAPAAASSSYNLGLVSDYRYRGISQARLHPALQGGADYADPASGLYAGTWLSTITWARDAGGGGHVEMDVYGGKRGTLASGVTWDIGLLGYLYPGNGLADAPGFVNGNTGEVYAQLGTGAWTMKYSNALTNLFGFVDSRYSSYLDLAGNLDAGKGFTINLHAGRQHVRHSVNASYTDWKAGVSRAWGPVTLSLAAVGTTASEAAYTSAANGKFLGRKALVLSLLRTF